MTPLWGGRDAAAPGLGPVGSRSAGQVGQEEIRERFGQRSPLLG